MNLKTILIITGILSACSEEAVDINSEIVQLIETGRSLKSPKVGLKLSSQLSIRRNRPIECQISVNNGDILFPLGDGIATHHAIVVCGEMKNLGIRLKILNSNRYEIIGFWTE